MLNDNIKNLRLAFSLSQVELAGFLGVSKQCVSNWENDYIQPSVDMLVKIAGFFNVTTDYLLGLDSEKRIDVSGLSDKEVAHIKLLISDLQNRKTNS